MAELRAGDTGVLERFWADVERMGTPLIEPLSGEADFLVTFLWRGGDETRNVRIVSGVTAMYGPTAGDLAEHQMRRIAGTDVWFRSYRLPPQTRFFYYLSPNDALAEAPPPLVPAAQLSGPQALARTVPTWQTDPLNPRREVRPHGDRDWIASVVALPEAPPEPWRDPPHALTGTVEAHVLASSVLGQDRGLWVYRPPEDLTGGQPPALVIAFDGGSPNVVRYGAQVLDYLMAEGRIQPAMAVWTAQQNRGPELNCSEQWNRFLVHELATWMRSRFGATSDPARTVVAGESLGGLAALCAGLENPDVFARVLSHSASLARDGEYGWIMRRFLAAPKRPIRIYLDVGTFEREFDILPANRHLRDVLLAKGYEVEYFEFSGGHDSAHYAITFANGLEALLPAHSPDR